MFYSLWPRNYQKYEKPYHNKNLRFNLFICVCGEPVEVVRETIQAAKRAAIAYYQEVKPVHPTRVIVLNDGKVANKDNWQEIASLAREEEVEHITRTTPGGFKAGNINNGLRETPTNNPSNTLDVVFDADFAAKKEFLLEIVKPFENPEVDFAQSPQRYKNENTWVAKAAAAHQIFFFEHICAAKGFDNALFLCGTNFAVRRSAFETIGGVDTNFITEDYATSLKLHLTGHKGVFVPKVLAEGIAPSSLKAYFSQQRRWSKGSLDVSRAYLKKILFGSLTLKQKFHYLLSASYYLIGMRDMILMLAPLPYLFFGVSLVKANTWQYLAFIYGPLIIYNFTLYLILFRHPIKSLVLDIASFPVFVAAFLSSALKKDLSFIVTIKKYEKENPFAVYKVQLLVAAVLGFGLYFALKNNTAHGGSLLNYFWASFDVAILTFGFYLIVRENFNTAIFEKIALNSLEQASKVPAIVLPRLGYTLAVGTAVVMLTLQTPYSATLASLGVSGKSDQSTLIQELLVPQNGIYYGYYLPALNSHPDNFVQPTYFGEKASLLMFYQDWSPESGFDANFLNKIASSGYVPIITWEPWNSKQALQDAYTPQAIVAGVQDQFIRNWAKGAAAYGRPFFLRFAHEMNGGWYQWGSKNGPETYVAMWQHIHDIFTAEGADNVIWLWSPNNTDEVGSTDSLLSFYPGDNYTDWIGFSGFNWGKSTSISNWISFDYVATRAYEKLSLINKPIMVAETSSASSGGDKESWFNQTLTTGLPKFPRIKAVVFFDQNFHNSDFSLTSGQDFARVVQNNITNNGYYVKDPVYKQKYLP
ncbi:MAG TPA: glycosyltransferase family 2 protein [Candidatus Nanoarchaeia archaeon]